jgi:ABC-type bacteriocin/lantibiotic exporter with double-glycine peptidase domain
MKHKDLLSGLFYRYRGLLFSTIAIGIVLNLMSLATPLSFMAVIDRVLISEGYASLTVILVILLVIAVMEQFLRMAQFLVDQNRA